ncbi:MAG: hypothetical protein AAF806_26410 [Bacteroidota bacterium]
MFYNESKIREFLEGYMDENDFSFLTIERVKKIPKNLVSIDWSLGIGAEVDYSYEVRFIDQEKSVRVIYFIVSTILNLFIVKKRCFLEIGGIFKMVSLETIKSKYLA